MVTEVESLLGTCSRKKMAEFHTIGLQCAGLAVFLFPGIFDNILCGGNTGI